VLTLPPAVKVYVATDPIDCRKSFDGISAAVASVLGEDPTSGHLFVFFNRRGNQCRILFWDRTGYCVLAKKLARGRFHFAARATAQSTHLEVEAAELALVLEGLDLSQAKKRLRWRKAA
jgi:transposase